jgi:uncharacterized alkaline shock family protein YloU
MSSNSPIGEQPIRPTEGCAGEPLTAATVSPDVVAVYVADAVKGVRGIAKLQGTSWQVLSGKSRSELPGSGVVVRQDELGRLEVDVHVCVAWGSVIPELAQEIQGVMSRRVEPLLGITLTSINLFVDGVDPPPSHP